MSTKRKFKICIVLRGGRHVEITWRLEISDGEKIVRVSLKMKWFKLATETWSFVTSYGLEKNIKTIVF